MKKIISIMVLGLALVNPVSSYAQKIGYVDAAYVFSEYDKKNGISKKLQEQFAPKRTELEALAGKVKALENEIKTNALLMTESKLDNSRQNLQKMIMEFRQKQMGVQQEFQRAQGVVSNKFNKIVSEIVNKYGKDKGYDLILKDGSAAYVADSMNITKEIIALVLKPKK